MKGRPGCRKLSGFKIQTGGMGFAVINRKALFAFWRTGWHCLSAAWEPAKQETAARESAEFILDFLSKICIIELSLLFHNFGFSITKQQQGKS